MYEYHVKRYLPAHIQLPHTFLKSHMPSMPRFTQYNKYMKRFNNNQQPVLEEENDDSLYLDIPPPYEVHPSHSRHSMTPFIGSIQVRVRYEFQRPPADINASSPFAFHHSNRSMDTFHSYLTTSRKSSQRSSTYSSSTSSSTAYEQLHDAIEPRLVVVDDLNSVVTSPSTPKPSTAISEDEEFEYRYYIDLERYKSDFPKMDGENKKKNNNETISDTASIKSHNFGDKNFAFRWINESFEEVAISHPSLDRMIGMVVSPQTRILLRAVVKMFNAFVKKINFLLYTRSNSLLLFI